MKAILMSIRPQYVAKILNGEKTIEIRKKFPIDYVGWVYIYCTKDGGLLTDNGENYYYIVENQECKKMVKNSGITINGQVVARFWCDKVEEIKSCEVPFTFEQTITDFYTDTFNDMDDLLKASCLDYYSLEQYLKYSHSGYAIHIAKLEIFEKPKEISEFHKPSWAEVRYKTIREEKAKQYRLSSVPQSWCYIEIGE